ncbi:MAG: urea ABC transporter permease subunit UrtB [Proteobacteria bacterium]|nr:urea ABC transporter permease subunit UrtB [Pseudomonadota bacterium]
MPRRITLSLLLLFAAVVIQAPARADQTADQLTGLTAKSFNAKIAAVETLAASGDARVVAPLTALLEGRLHIRKADGAIVIVKTRNGEDFFFDPLTGAPLGEAKPRSSNKIRLNNRLRGVLHGALGALTLFSPEVAQRLTAAQAMFKSAGAESLLPLAKAYLQETDASVRAALARTLAAVRLRHGSDEEKLLAAKMLADFPDRDVRDLLANTAQTAQGELLAAVARTSKGIERRLSFFNILQYLFQGLSLGSVLLLAAIGLAITFGVMGVINMAHGEMVMLGAYTTHVAQVIFHGYFPGAYTQSLLLAIPCAFLVTGLFGILLERSVIRFLYGRPLETLLATWGLSLILQQFVRSVFGPTNREVIAPSWMSGSIEITGGLALTNNRICIIVFAILVFLVLTLLIRYTDFGLRMRAVTQNRAMADAVGIRSSWVDAMTFGLGSGVAGLAGVALSQIDNVSPNLGQGYIIDSFLVVVFGGVGNLWGTLVAALTLGLGNKFLEPYAGAVLGKILILVLVILFIQKRPRGLFALKGRAAES